MLTKILHTLTLSTLNVVFSGKMDTAWKYKSQSTINTSVFKQNYQTHQHHCKLKPITNRSTFDTERKKKTNFKKACTLNTEHCHMICHYRIHKILNRLSIFDTDIHFPSTIQHYMKQMQHKMLFPQELSLLFRLQDISH